VVAGAQRKHRRVWDQPVIWREMRTRAYGRRMIWIKLCYVLLAVLVAAASWVSPEGGTGDGGLVLGMVSAPSFAVLGIGILSLLLSNAQAVTSITNERDGRTLEILLVTDLRPWEFMFGKIGGAVWNAREMLLLPLLLVGALCAGGVIPQLTAENAIYVSVGYTVLTLFAVALGLHAGLSYENSRQAIAHSLGTMFFLCVGIFVFMLLLVEARSSFAIQLQSFILFIGFGSLGLYSSLTHRNPSNALTMASLLLPFLTFYAITEFLLGGNLGVCFWICMAYGFAAVAMMVPAMNDLPVEIRGEGQGRGNSGCYLMGLYEVQVLDSFQNQTYFDGQAGSIYKQTPPLANAMRKPGEWNTYQIIFNAPRFRGNGDVERPAYVTLIQNGVLLLNNFELYGPTSYTEAPHYKPHAETGPISLQFHGDAVRFRNIWLRELKPVVGRRVSAPFNLPLAPKPEQPAGTAKVETPSAKAEKIDAPKK